MHGSLCPLPDGASSFWWKKETIINDLQGPFSLSILNCVNILFMNLYTLKLSDLNEIIYTANQKEPTNIAGGSFLYNSVLLFQIQARLVL